ncbi:MAG: arylsulfatase [Candidatus Hydrogenedentota bacterium]
MSRRHFMGITAGATGAGLLGKQRVAQAQGNTPKPGPKTDKPNILFIMDDQHRGDCLGCDGHPVLKTPNFDRIAREGARFRHAYTSTPSCTPARAGLLTGLSPWNHGMLGYAAVAEQYPYEMPTALKQAGYYTCGIGKMHWAPQRNKHGMHEVILDESGREQDPEFKSDYRCWFSSLAPVKDPDATGIGWNDYTAAPYALDERLHPTRWTGDVAVNFLEQYDKEQPFYLKVSFARPHSPYDAPKRFWDMYKDADIPERFIGDWASRYEERSSDSDSLWHGDLGPEAARTARIGYYGNVSFIDEQVGRMLDALEERGILENTLILFVSDHGDMTGDHHMWRKTYAYEPSARVPMLIRWPESLDAAQRGQVREEPVEIRDIFPTFLDAAGATPAQELDGASMLALTRGNTEHWRPWIDLEHDVCYSKRNHWTALTDGKTKYIFHAFDGEEQLFDLVNDPGEETDLAKMPAHSDTLRTWRSRMVEHLAPRGETWVKDGELVLHKDSIKYSPNYPKKT